MPEVDRAVAWQTSELTNVVKLTGRLSEREVLRYTPAGVPVVEFRIDHRSEQVEAGKTRLVECELACVALDSTALMLKSASLGMGLTVEGFLAARSLKQKMPVLHATTIEFDERV